MIIPPIAVLGVAETFLRTTNVTQPFSAYNLGHLRSEVLAPFYPLPVGGLIIVFSMYAPVLPTDLALVFKKRSGEWFTITVATAMFNPREEPPEPGAVDVAPAAGHTPWLLFGVPFPSAFAIVEEPGEVSIYLRWADQEVRVGGVVFLSYEP